MSQRPIPDRSVIQALAVTAELTGTNLSPAAARILAQDVAGYPPAQVLGALDRCRKELKGRLTVADIIARLDDGRPDPEEAWAMIPRDEGASCVWTDEMAEAYGIAARLMVDGLMVQARLAFLEQYKRLVTAARDKTQPVRWTPSLGHDVHGREPVLADAVRRGRLTASHAQSLLPSPQQEPGRVLELSSGIVKGIPS